MPRLRIVLIASFLILVLRLVALVTVAAVLLVLIPVPAYASPDTTTLRPDAAGDLTEWDLGAGTSNWEAVYTDDGDTTYVYQSAETDEDDLYNIGTDALLTNALINSVTVYAVAKSVKSGSGSVSAQPFYILVRPVPSGTTYADAGRAPATSYTSYSNVWSLNPADSAAWEKADIDALQVGIRGSTMTGGSSGRHQPSVTQVYVVVDYTPPAVASYSDIGRTVPEENFTVLGAPVYMKATGLANGQEYQFDYLDADSTTLLQDGPIVAASNQAVSEITPSNYPASAAGLWTCNLYRIGVGLQATDTFNVQQSAIPEFPTAMCGALVAGICFGFYYWMRRRTGYAPA